MKRLKAGQTITGYCRGFFGRDSYGQKMVIADGIHHLGLNTKIPWAVTVEDDPRAEDDGVILRLVDGRYAMAQIIESQEDE